jgi:hypothetical protein
MFGYNIVIDNAEIGLDEFFSLGEDHWRTPVFMAMSFCFNISF